MANSRAPDPLPCHIPDPTPSVILRKYVGTFQASNTNAIITNALTKNNLYITYPGALFAKLKIVNKSNRNKSTPTKTIEEAPKEILETAAQTVAPAVPETAPSTLPQAVPQATPQTKPKPRAGKSTLKSATASKKATRHAPYPAPKAVSTPIATNQPTTAAPTPVATTVPSLLYLAVNGVPQFRVSGATPEETEMNKELQAMGLVAPENKLVAFDVKMGKIRGVRVEGRMFDRVKEVEK
ncbi:hypothetical protein FB567DRAFT_549179 [Paraphoma chrysanthemicola]|uniref:Uncharacterized protein n=1 Tax=Paraphoma chrysanthemicola TaxID=798071 RepID=A0A8K0VXH7_9PLEO|nr:hypothetical protein FB567DRAFT_549179 [Paraphoma chrysanthemicola]